MQVLERASKLFLLTVFMSEVYTYYTCVHMYIYQHFLLKICVCVLGRLQPIEAGWKWLTGSRKPILLG